MSILDTLRQDALDTLHATVNSLHADFATKLAQAGHDVTADDHADKLVVAAVSASAGPGNPPTYADHALASFSLSMTHALLQFATQHLPAKFLPILSAAEPAVEQGVLDLSEHKPLDTGSVLNTVVDVAETAASVLIPGAAPIVAVAAPLISAAERAIEGGRPSGESAGQSVVSALETVVEPLAEKAASSLLPGIGGTLADMAVHAAAEEADAMLAKPDQTPPMNHSGV